MSSNAILSLEHSIGFRGGKGSVLTSHGTILYGFSAGVATASLGNPDYYESLWYPGNDNVHEISCIAIHPSETLLCIAHHSLRVSLFVFEYPSRKLLQQISDISRIHVTAMEFTMNGSLLALASGPPLCELTFFSVTLGTGSPLHKIQQPLVLEEPLRHISFQPNIGQYLLCGTGTEGNIRFWTCQKIDNSIEERNIPVIGFFKPVINVHLWLPNGIIMVGTDNGKLFYSKVEESLEWKLYLAFKETKPITSLALFRSEWILVGMSNKAIYLCSLSLMKSISIAPPVLVRSFQHFLVSREGNYAVVISDNQLQRLEVNWTSVDGANAENTHEEDICSSPVGFNFSHERPIISLSNIRRGCESDVVDCAHLSSAASTLLFLSKSGFLLAVDYEMCKALWEIYISRNPLAIHVYGPFILIPLLDGNLCVLRMNGPSSPELVRHRVVASSQISQYPDPMNNNDNESHADYLRLFPDDTSEMAYSTEKYQGKDAVTTSNDNSDNMIISAFSDSLALLTVMNSHYITFVDISSNGIVKIRHWCAHELNMVTHLSWVLHHPYMVIGQSDGHVWLINPPSTLPNSNQSTMVLPWVKIFVNSWRLDFPFQTILPVYLSDEMLHIIVHAVDRETKLYTLDLKLQNDRKERESKSVRPHFIMRDHDKPGKILMLFTPIPILEQTFDKNKYTLTNNSQNSTDLSEKIKPVWLLSGGSDGVIVVRDALPYMEPLVSSSPSKDLREPLFKERRHVSVLGGVVTLSASPGNEHIISFGKEGGLFIWQPHALMSNISSRGYASYDRNLFSLQRKSRSVEVAPHKGLDDNLLMEVAPNLLANNGMITTLIKENSMGIDATAGEISLEKGKLANLSYVEDLINQIDALHAINQRASESEKVNIMEFLLPRQREAFKEKCQAAISQMRQDEKYEELRRDFTIDLIRQKYWNAMEVKQNFISGIIDAKNKLQNFPYRYTPLSTYRILRKIKFLRHCEMGYHQRRMTSKSGSSTTNRAWWVVESEIFESNGMGEENEGIVPPSHFLNTTLSLPSPENVDDLQEATILIGTLPLTEEARQDPSRLLYHPLDLYTMTRRCMQCFLLFGQRLHLQSSFNLLFQNLEGQKRLVISLIEESNSRCTQILEVLQESDSVNYQMIIPKISEGERDPSSIFTIRDEDVPADKSHDPAEVRRKEEMEEERNRWMMLHGEDDGAAERALSTWMDGLGRRTWRLTVDIPSPDFMDELSEKYLPPDERTEEQTRVANAHVKLVAQRQEEVDNLRLELQQEFANLQKENESVANKFDSSLRDLIDTRLNYMEKIFLTELMQLKCIEAMLLHQQQLANATVAWQTLQNSRNNLKSQTTLLQKAVDALENITKIVEHLEELERRAVMPTVSTTTSNFGLSTVAQKKKGLSSSPFFFSLPSLPPSNPLNAVNAGMGNSSGLAPFSASLWQPVISITTQSLDLPFDDPGHGEFFTKAFKKFCIKWEKNNRSHATGSASYFSSSTGGESPLSRRAYQIPLGSAGLNSILERFEELNNTIGEDSTFSSVDQVVSLPTQPSHISDEKWKKFTDFISLYIKIERQLVTTREVLFMLETYVSRLKAAEGLSIQGCDEADQRHKEALETLSQDTFNVYIFFSMKQGNIEVPVVNGQLPDFSDAVVVRVPEVERFNQLISASVQEKIQLLRDKAAQHLESELMQWEICRLQYSIQTFGMELRHLHTVRVTRHMQEILCGRDQETVEMQKQKLEKQLTYVREKMTKSLEDVRRHSITLDRDIEDRELENKALEKEISEAHALVRERQEIYKLQDYDKDMEATSERLKEIQIAKNLKSLVVSREKEAIELRESINKRREAMFPSFAVVLKRVVKPK